MIANHARLLFDPGNEALRFLPEGPYPCGPDRFSWVAIQHGPDANSGSLNIYDLRSQKNTSYLFPGRPGFAFVTDRGNFVVGCERGVGIYSPRDAVWKPFIQGIDARVTGTIVNDGITWNGNLIFGTKDLEFKTKKAGLYFWRRSDRRLFQLRSDQICSNGKCVVPVDEHRILLYDIDSPTRQVVKYTIDLLSGTSDEPRVVIDLRTEAGVPDGMTMTPDGRSAIISLYQPEPAPQGRTIQVSFETGEVEKVWTVDASPQVTCPQWVSYNGNAALVMTTAVENMPSSRRAESPNAGSIFMCETEIPWEESTFGRMTPVFLE
ncbi:MAG: SMP-30/gluconolactonase/LRE family protein [Planctomycetota bacterium]|jgi:sugar lactone lactonase YvrE